ncbi:hypothetical protein J6590_071135 [Homalodisca vitripennis]|nr:hypothetical protein J6590_071135 [Homalodisca vitripennis]
MKMIQRRNSRRFILSELNAGEEKEKEPEAETEDSSNSQCTPPPEPPLHTPPPSHNEILKWRSIKSLRAQIT